MIGKNFVNQPVLLSNAARPAPGQILFKRLRFACAPKRIPQYFCNQGIYLAKNLSIFFGPLAIVSKGRIFKTDQCLAQFFGTMNCLFEIVKGNQIFPMVYILDSIIQALPIGRRTTEVLGLILFANHYFNILVRICFFDGVDKIISQFLCIEPICRYHTGDYNM